MKRILVILLLLLVILAAFFLGKGYGGKGERERLASYIASGAEGQLMLQLEVLEEIEEGNIQKARWMIQSSTGGQFDLISEFADFHNSNRRKFQCVLLSRYRDYYKEKKLFSTQEWANIMKVDGMKEAERKRWVFFEKDLPLICVGK